VTLKIQARCVEVDVNVSTDNPTKRQQPWQEVLLLGHLEFGLVL
jgi:hypothetical protein